MEYMSKSEKETHNIAKKILALSKPGDVFALFGDLGSGKTTFVKGFAKALRIKKTITSPTFVILKEYSIQKKRIEKLIHLDCYRLSDPIEAENIGLLEYFKKNNVVILIEWPEKIEEVLPKRTKKIYFEYVDENTRKIRLE